MAMSLKLAREKFGFSPRFSNWDADYYLRNTMTKCISNSKLYSVVERISKSAHPTFEDKYDRKWSYLYLPLRRSGKLICVPFVIVQYKSILSVFPHSLGNLEITKGKDYIDDDLTSMFEEALKLIPIIKEHGQQFISKTVPYDIRLGKIKGKHVMRGTLRKKEGKSILRSYRDHIEKQKDVRKISLKEYLETASICYKAAFNKKTNGLTPLEQYNKWADGRDEGMLQIKDAGSKQAFSEWEENRIRGGHPFEIVFSWSGHGIHLYPPYVGKHSYSISVTNMAYADAWIEMVKVLIQNQVSFTAHDMEDVVQYLSGESHFNVNVFIEPFFIYIPSRESYRKYFKHISWEELQIPVWK